MELRRQARHARNYDDTQECLGVADQVLLGGTGYNAVNAMATANSAGIKGSAVNGLNVEILVNFTSIPAAGQYLTSRFEGGASNLGWSLSTSAIGVITFATFNSVTAFSSPGYTVVAGDLGKVFKFSGVWDTAGFTRLYKGGVQVGAGTAAATYAPGGVIRQSWGLRNNGAQPFTAGTIYAIQGGDFTLSGAEIAAAWELDKINATLTATAGKTEHQWIVGRDAVPPTFPTTITDRIGTDNMTTWFGSPPVANLVTTTPVVWG